MTILQSSVHYESDQGLPHSGSGQGLTQCVDQIGTHLQEQVRTTAPAISQQIGDNQRGVPSLAFHQADKANPAATPSVHPPRTLPLHGFKHPP